MNKAIDLIVTNAKIYTCDPAREWAEAFAVTAGVVTAVGTAAEIATLASTGTEILDADGRMIMPGLCDVHSHLMIGGAQAAWELTMLPSDGIDTILAKVRDWAERLAPDEWVVGGIIGSPVLDQIALGGCLPALDEASGGRPVLLRDDSHHNRWVNSRALELMGVNQATPNPDDGTYVRDSHGKLTGVLYESACALAEDKAAASIKDHRERDRVSAATAVRLVNSYGITAVQDAGTLENALLALSDPG
ncbi:amidohydrolase family protein [Paenarthrobacter ureafaciens]